MSRATDLSDGESIGSLLLRWQDPAARERLFLRLYPELHRAAQLRMRGERLDHTLQPTALVNEVFLQLARMDSVVWQNKSHFLAIASESMRRILVDHARVRAAQRRPGGKRVPLESVDFASPEDFASLLELDSLLNRLAARNTRLARVVELRYFGGLTFPEIGEVLGMCERTAKRDWHLAREWLFAAMNAEAGNGRPAAAALSAD